MIPHASVTACTLRSAPGRTARSPRGAGLGESVAAVGGTDPSPRHTTRWGEPRAPGTGPRLRLPPQVPRHPGLSQRQLLFTGPICEQGVLGTISSCRRRVKCRNRGDRDPPAIKQARHGPAGVSSTPFPWCHVAAPEGAVVLPDRAGGANGPLSAGTDDLPEAEGGCNWRLRYTG